MTTEHKLAWALRAAAEDEKAQFECSNIMGICTIGYVINHPNHDWKLVKPPVVTHEYYIKQYDNSYKRIENPNVWNMHITLIDGVPQKEVEFR